MVLLQLIMRVEQPPTPEVLLTVVPEVNQIHLSDASGNPISVNGEVLPQVLEPHKHGRAAELISWLAAAYIRNGAGEHEIAKQATDHSGRVVAASYSRHLAELLPGILVSHQLAKDSPSRRQGSTVTFGNMALASRKATETELAERARRIAEAGGEEFLYAVETTRAAEAHKIDLTIQDHMRFSFRGSDYMISLETPEAILAARLIEAVANMPGKANTPARNLALEAWNNMPLAERALFVDGLKLYRNSPSSDVIKQIESIVIGLTGQLQITRRGQGSYNTTSYNTTNDPLTISIESAPVEEHSTYVKKIYPPNTPIEHVRGLTVSPLSTEDIRQAQEILAKIEQRTLRTHEEAIEIVDIVMRTDGRRAIRAALSEAGSRAELKDTLASLHALANKVLGWAGYSSAVRGRLIAGYSQVGRGSKVEQIGGRLKADRTRWHIDSRDVI